MRLRRPSVVIWMGTTRGRPWPPIARSSNLPVRTTRPLDPLAKPARPPCRSATCAHPPGASTCPSSTPHTAESMLLSSNDPVDWFCGVYWFIVMHDGFPPNFMSYLMSLGVGVFAAACDIRDSRGGNGGRLRGMCGLLLLLVRCTTVSPTISCLSSCACA